MKKYLLKVFPVFMLPLVISCSDDNGNKVNQLKFNPTNLSVVEREIIEAPKVTPETFKEYVNIEKLDNALYCLLDDKFTPISTVYVKSFVYDQVPIQGNVFKYEYAAQLFPINDDVINLETSFKTQEKRNKFNSIEYPACAISYNNNYFKEKLRVQELIYNDKSLRVRFLDDAMNEQEYKFTALNFEKVLNADGELSIPTTLMFSTEFEKIFLAKGVCSTQEKWVKNYLNSCDGQVLTSTELVPNLPKVRGPKHEDKIAVERPPVPKVRLSPPVVEREEFCEKINCSDK